MDKIRGTARKESPSRLKPVWEENWTFPKKHYSQGEKNSDPTGEVHLEKFLSYPPKLGGHHSPLIFFQKIFDRIRSLITLRKTIKSQTHSPQ